MQTLTNQEMKANLASQITRFKNQLATLPIDSTLYKATSQLIASATRLLEKIED